MNSPFVSCSIDRTQVIQALVVGISTNPGWSDHWQALQVGSLMKALAL
ncbi:hypothetical protein [Synechococcus sp. CCY 9618]|nr:hypothetical protein [Synechococcus sp. CCY 9618]